MLTRRHFVKTATAATAGIVFCGCGLHGPDQGTDTRALRRARNGSDARARLPGRHNLSE